MSDDSDSSADPTPLQEINSPESARPVLGTPKGDQASEPWFIRLRFVVFSQHQTLVGSLLFLCLVGMPGYFLYQASQNDGLLEIDQATPLRAEFKIDINHATLGEIVVLPGVGEKLAQAILTHRQSNGPFESLEAIASVPGIGPRKLEKLRPFLLPLIKD